MCFWETETKRETDRQRDEKWYYNHHYPQQQSEKRLIAWHDVHHQNVFDHDHKMANCSFEENAHIRGKQCCLLWIYSALLSTTQLTPVCTSASLYERSTEQTSAFFLLLLSHSLWLSLLFAFIQSQQEHRSIKKIVYAHLQIFPCIFISKRWIISSTYSLYNCLMSNLIHLLIWYTRSCTLYSAKEN